MIPVQGQPWLIAALNTCAVPLRRRKVRGALAWCSHRWIVVAFPVPTCCVVECRWCKHSMSFPSEFLEGEPQGEHRESPSAPNITGTGT